MHSTRVPVTSPTTSKRLYLYVYRRLIEGNVRLDRNAILEAKGIMRDLYDAWQAIILGQDSTRPADDSWVELSRLSA